MNVFLLIRRARRGKLAIALSILTLAVSACQTLPQRIEIPESKSIKDVTEYVEISLKDESYSMDTLLMLIEDYFAESAEILKTRYSAYEMEKNQRLAGRVQEEPEPPMPDHDKFIKGLATLLDKYPEKPNADKLAYAISYALFESGKTIEAKRSFEDLVVKYPESPYSNEASFRLGEILFDEEDYGEALHHYDAVVRSNDETLGPKAIYKTAWINYKLDDFDDAIENFVLLLDSSDVKRRGSESALAIREESIDNMVLSLSRSVAPEKFLKDIMKKAYGPDVLFRLGVLLSSEMRHEKSLAAFRLFMDNFGEHPRAPFAFEGAAKSLAALNDIASAMKTKEELVSRFNPKSAWYGENFPNGDKEITNLVSRTILDLARHYHSVAKESGNKADMQSALYEYTLYLSYFPDDLAAKEAGFLLAEAMFDSKRYLEAANRYESAMAAYGDMPEGEDAALNALLSFEISLSGNDRSPDAGEKTAASVKRITEKYLEQFKKPKNAEAVLTKASGIYVSLGMTKDAREALEPLFKTPSAFKAYEKTGDIFALEKDFSSAIAYYKNAMPDSKNDPVRKKLSSAHYALALDYLKKGGDDEAIKHFFNVYSVMKESPLAEDALAGAGSIYLRTGNRSGIRTILDIMEAKYPSGKASYSLLMEAGKTFEGKGEYLDAAGMFEKAASASGADERKKLLLKAADMLEKAGEPDRLRTLVDSAMEAGHITERDKPSFLFRLAMAELASGNEDKAYSILKALAKDKLDPFHAAKASFASSGMKLDEYLRTKIKDPVKASFKKKETQMKELLEGYGAAIKSGYAEFMASGFYNMGMVLENFKDSLLSSSKPPDLSDDEIKEYDYLLEEKAYPLEEEAVGAYRGSIKALFEHGGLESSGYAEKALFRLAVLRPALYKRDILSKEFAVIDPPAEPYAKEESKEFFSLLNSANLYHGKKELSGALGLYKKAEGIAPEDPYLNYNMGILLMKNKDKSSIEKLGKSLALKDAHPEVLEAYAYSLFLFGDVKGALAFYEDLVKNRSELPWPHKNSGIIYEIFAGDYARALERYKTYLSVAGKDGVRAGQWITLIEERLKK
ncbi:MAG: tetratricopeptide repeat protein [Thermodesulfobacteriota bacterium]